MVVGPWWCPWAREGIDEARLLAGDGLRNGEEICSASARLYALQTVKLSDLNYERSFRFHQYKRKEGKRSAQD